ncbi:hypothetical protein ACIG2M_09510 [Lysinibacillus fusiformis]|uniref:hypothetical protein n=1 Tax=Lysinibacillus fusiformis TaxID=28031 RepID=UPI0037C5FAA1
MALFCFFLVACNLNKQDDNEKSTVITKVNGKEFMLQEINPGNFGEYYIVL